ncbi:RNA pseudouridylate synthase domain-containing protein 1-like isoform X3 [Dermacentor variabilis]|uniref:RNA pseudouridylate synthase domain-containing protein 1-like isoform X3 n=1 Tax=Dermacentor variabilis TaxID=34621 RepID=UPI003F5B0C51
MVIVTGDASGTAICSVEPTNRDAKVNGDEEIHVLHRSEHFLVVDKPADLVINTQKAHEHPVTVETLLRRQCPELIDPSVEHGFRFCHRLDFATSGVLCLALTRAAARAAQAAFGPPLRTARKCYAALLDGHVAVPAGWCGIEIELAVGNDRREGHRHKMCTANVEYCVNARGAVTRLLVLGWGLFHGRATTQVVLKPVTGRRHQLRLHCAAVGHPVVGDTTYGDARAAGHSRMYLHAWRLQLPTRLAVIDVSTGSKHPFCQHQAWQDLPSRDGDLGGRERNMTVCVNDAFDKLECSELFLAWRTQSPWCCVNEPCQPELSSKEGNS